MGVFGRERCRGDHGKARSTMRRAAGLVPAPEADRLGRPWPKTDPEAQLSGAGGAGSAALALAYKQTATVAGAFLTCG